MTLRQGFGSLLTRRRALALGAIAGGVALSAHHAGAVVRLDITEGNFQPLPIAIPKFIGAAEGGDDTSAGVTQIITSNLQRSGLFAPVDPVCWKP